MVMSVLLVNDWADHPMRTAILPELAAMPIAVITR
jgi:hypothetical protein